MCSILKRHAAWSLLNVHVIMVARATKKVTLYNKSATHGKYFQSTKFMARLLKQNANNIQSTPGMFV